MTSIVSSVTNVFTEMISWFTEAMTEVGSIFFTAEAGLTLIGTITVIGVSFAVALKVISMIRSLLRLH